MRRKGVKEVTSSEEAYRRNRRDSRRAGFIICGAMAVAILLGSFLGEPPVWAGLVFLGPLVPAFIGLYFVEVE